jgi:hypothetical protein
MAAFDVASALKYSPTTNAAIRRSKYLEDALSQQSQSQQPIKGWGELAAKLGEAFILERSRKKSDATLTDALAKEAEARKAAILGQFGIGAPQPTPQAPTPTQAPTQAPAVSVDPIRAASMAPGAPQALPASPSPSRGAALMAALTEGDARGVVGSLFPGSRVTSGTRTPQHNRDVGGAPRSYHLFGGALDFLAPGMTKEKIAAALRAKGLPVTELMDEGDHFHWAYGRRGADTQPSVPQAQMTGGPAPQGQMQVSPTMSGGLAGGPPQAPQPPQQPMGFPPMPEPQPQQAPPQAPQQAPQQAWGPAPGELQYLQQLASDPRTIDAAQAYADELRKKYAAPPKMETYSANGVPMAFNPYAAQAGALPVPQGAMNRTTTAGQLNLPGDPNAAYSVSPYGKPDAITTAPPGYNFGPNGSMAPAQGGPADPYRVQTPPQGYQMGAQGMAPVAGGPADISGNPQARFEALKGMRAEVHPIIDRAIAIKRSYNAVQAGYAINGGPGDLAMVNGFQKLIDEGVVKGEDVDLQLRAQGIKGGIAGIRGYMTSDGIFSDPSVRKAVMDAATQIYDRNSGTYRDQIMGYRGMVDRTFGDGSFADILPPETAAALGWTAQPQGQGAAAAAPTAPKVPPGRDDIEKEMRRRGLIR